MMLLYGGIDHNYHTIEFDEWDAGTETAFKEMIPSGHTGRKQLPVLKCLDGSLMSESLDIANYIANIISCNKGSKNNDDGANPDQQQYAEKLFMLREGEKYGSPLGFDNYGLANPILNWFPKEKSIQMIPSFLELLPSTLTYIAEELKLSKSISKSNSSSNNNDDDDCPLFFGGNEPNMGDFQVFHYVNNICTLDGGFTMNHRISQTDTQTLQNWYNSIQNIPVIGNYLSNRPKPGTKKIGRPGSIMYTETDPSMMEIVQVELKKYTTT
jgi:glutaredoxin 2